MSAQHDTDPLSGVDDLDLPIFEQILDMDDDTDDRDFSQQIVFDFFAQADHTFGEMRKALDEEDLPQLASFGHFLKGSSATLGFTKIRDECEKIQQNGLQKDEHQEKIEDKKLCLNRIRDAIAGAEYATDAMRRVMEQYYRINRATVE